MSIRRLSPFALAAALAIGTWTSPADATLTDSEKAQVRDFYTRGDSVNAPRVRALLARPDLSSGEIRETFTAAARGTRFDEKHEKFVRDLLFGPASQASRSELLTPIIEGLLARASAVISAPGGEVARADELMRIHGFVTSDVARATRTAKGTGAAAIRSDALKSVVQAYRAHLAAPALDSKNLSATLRPVRVQAELALAELARDVHPRSDIATWVAHSPQTRTAFARTGVLVHGLAGAPVAKSHSVVRMVEAFPQATRGLSVLWIDKPWPRQLILPGGMVVAQARLGGSSSVASETLWSSSVEPAKADAAMAEVAYVLSRAGAANLLASDAAFRKSAALAIVRARRAGLGGFLAVATTRVPIALGDPSSISEQSMLTHTTKLLLLDAPRALALAIAHASAEQYEPMEQFALALGLLAADGGGTLAATTSLGAVELTGATKTVQVQALVGTPARLDAFTFGELQIELTRAGDGAVTGVQVDGAAIDLKKLELARSPTTPGPAWAVAATKASSQLRFELMTGLAEMGFPTSSTLLVRAMGDARAAVHAASPGPEYSISGRVLRAAPGSAVMLRARVDNRAISGVAIEFRGSGKARSARFVTFDDRGKALSLGPDIPLGENAEQGHPFKVTLRRADVTFELGGKSIKSALPAGLALPKHFDKDPRPLALVAGKGGDLIIEGLSVQVPPTQ